MRPLVVLIEGDMDSIGEDHLIAHFLGINMFPCFLIPKFNNNNSLLIMKHFKELPKA